MPWVISLKQKDAVNENFLAQLVAAREGGAVNLNIAEIKEVMRHTLDVLGGFWKENPRGVAALLEKHNQ